MDSHQSYLDYKILGLPTRRYELLLYTVSRWYAKQYLFSTIVTY
jgi:hypothetical protein